MELWFYQIHLELLDKVSCYIYKPSGDPQKLTKEIIEKHPDKTFVISARTEEKAKEFLENIIKPQLQEYFVQGG